MCESKLEGNDRLEDNRGSPDRFKSVGIEGPNISVSKIPLRSPRLANASARLTAFHQKFSSSISQHPNLQSSTFQPLLSRMRQQSLS